MMLFRVTQWTQLSYNCPGRPKNTLNIGEQQVFLSLNKLQDVREFSRSTPPHSLAEYSWVCGPSQDAWLYLRNYPRGLENTLVLIPFKITHVYSIQPELN